MSVNRLKKGPALRGGGWGDCWEGEAPGRKEKRAAQEMGGQRLQGALVGNTKRSWLHLWRSRLRCILAHHRSVSKPLQSRGVESRTAHLWWSRLRSTPLPARNTFMLAPLATVMSWMLRNKERSRTGRTKLQVRSPPTTWQPQVCQARAAQPTHYLAATCLPQPRAAPPTHYLRAQVCQVKQGSTAQTLLRTAHSLLGGHVEPLHQVAAALGQGDGVVAVERFAVRADRPARLGHVDLDVCGGNKFEGVTEGVCGWTACARYAAARPCMPCELHHAQLHTEPALHWLTLPRLCPTSTASCVNSPRMVERSTQFQKMPLSQFLMVTWQDRQVAHG